MHREKIAHTALHGSKIPPFEVDHHWLGGCAFESTALANYVWAVVLALLLFTSYTLNSTGSSDADGDPLLFRWTQTAEPQVTLNAASSATPIFTAPHVSTETTLTFQLIVNDGTIDSTPAQVTITVKALPSSAGQVSSGGSGGGCTINPGAEFAPVFMGIMALWLASRIWQHAKKGSRPDRVHGECNNMVVLHSRERYHGLQSL
jgi:hypothetical protein